VIGADAWQLLRDARPGLDRIAEIAGLTPGSHGSKAPVAVFELLAVTDDEGSLRRESPAAALPGLAARQRRAYWRIA